MEKFRYVEVTDGIKFRAVVPLEPMQLHAAEEMAVHNAASAWGIPVDQVHQYMTRTVSAKKHARLVAAVKAGTLDHWACRTND